MKATPRHNAVLKPCRSVVLGKADRTYVADRRRRGLSWQTLSAITGVSEHTLRRACDRTYIAGRWARASY